MLSSHAGQRRSTGCLPRFVRACGQPVFGFSFSGGVGLRPGKKLVQVEIEIRCNSSPRITDFLDDVVFHIWGLVRSSGVQITGMWRRW